MAEHPEVEQDQARALRDAQEHLAATREVLEALGRSGDDPSAVLDVVVERAAGLCEAQAAQLYLIAGDEVRISRVSGARPRGCASTCSSTHSPSTAPPSVDAWRSTGDQDLRVRSFPIAPACTSTPPSGAWMMCRIAAVMVRPLRSMLPT